MNDPENPRPLSEKILRRHVEMLADLLPLATRLVLEEGRPADVVLAHHLRNHKELGSRDRRFLSQAIFAYFRWYGWTVNRLGLAPTEACLVGTLLESTELSESFAYLASRCSWSAEAEPLGRLSLVEKAAALEAWFAGRSGFEPPLTPAQLVNGDFSALVDPAYAERCIEAFQQRPPTWMRVRGSLDEVLDALARHRIAGRPSERVTGAVAVEGGSGLQHALGAQSGQFVVQDLASQCVGRICAPGAGEAWWDCCAGAGGKSLHLMDMMGPEGRVLATDVRPEALQQLKKRARRYGIRGIQMQRHNAAAHEPMDRQFDGVLVDAPCSGWGTWARNPDACWRSSKHDVLQCATRQLKILDQAAWCVKPGGALVYAVCTITLPETEEVVARFLDRSPGFQLDPFEHPLSGEMTDGQVQLWPWSGPGDGMFVARFVRVK